MRTIEGYWARPWTESEVEYLKDNYGSVPSKQIAEKLGRSYSAVMQRGKIEGLTSRHRAGANSLTPGYFQKIDTPEKAYILGMIAADGTVSDRGQVVLALHKKDVEIVEFVRDQVSPESRLGETTAGLAVFRVQSPEMAADLARWGVIPRKSCVIQWPTGLSEEMGRGYLHGYFDGNGYLGRKRATRWALVSGSIDFLTGVQEFVQNTHGIRIGGPYRDKRKEFAWSIVATGAPARELDRWIQQDGLGLARKRL